MKNGDLSNESPKRVLVALPYVALPPDSTPWDRVRRWRHNGAALGAAYRPLPATIANLWRMANRYGLLMEIFAIGIDQRELDAVLDKLDRGQAHPFTHATAYLTLNEFISTLPYRPEIIGVIDEPERGMRYGHWYMSTNGL